MEFSETPVRDCFRVVPRRLADGRGCFFESYKHDELLRATGHAFTPLQVNYSVSRRNTLRGVHGVRLPPGQAKYVTCVRGTLLDIVADVRPGSPTFGRHARNVLRADEGTAVYIADGLGHGFVALSDEACISYLCSTQYVAGTQFDINPFDPELDLPWDLAEPPVISAKDASAPSLAEAVASGVVASYAACRAVYERQREAASSQDEAGVPTVRP